MIQEEEWKDKKKEIYKTSFSLFDIKPLVLSKIDNAQDINNPYSLSRLRFYEQYHIPLEKWFKNKYNKMPSKADKLAFIILLSYPKNFIINALSFDEFKLFNTKDEDNSDFKLVGVIDIEFNENDEFNDDHIDCICSKDNLKYVSRVENKYSHIELYIGSECIRKYKIISQEEINKINEINEKQRERQKELKEGLPIGYYEEQRKLDKIKKKEEKIKKENDKIQKKIESGNYRICYLCNNTLINIRYNNDKRICDKCDIQINIQKSLTDIYKSLHSQINLLCKRYTCNNCEFPFITFLSGSDYLCKKCIIEYKIVSCKICNNNILININSNEIYCQDCEEKLFKCVDCNEKFIRDIYQIDRCKTCQLCFENRMILQKCQDCECNFPRKEKEHWRVKCLSCFKSINIKPKINDNYKSSKLEIKNEINNIYHEKFELKSKLCGSCDEEFDINPIESWKTLCKECFKKSKNIYICSNCEDTFTRLSNESWKTMCYKCYKYFKNI
jgi:hypothetical protein